MPLRLTLAAAACPYSIVIRLRNFLYSKNCLKPNHTSAAVFSIGNITAGGTGKTPLVIWLCKFLKQKQVKCAILTRGYKTHTQKQTLTDEPAILAESCPQAKVIVNPNRVEAADKAINDIGANVLIMDDGFQHRRLHRDLDIITIDGTCPFGYGKLLPAGLLREPAASLKRANAVVITRCDQISESESKQIEKSLQLINPDMIIARSIHAPIYIKSITGEEISLEKLRNRKIFAFCGIGNPEAFLNTIKNTGADLAGSRTYNDHYNYTEHCLTDISGQARRLKADLILTTQKDWSRITPPASAPKSIPFAYLAVEIEFLAGEDKLKQLIEDTLECKIQSLQNNK